MADEKGVWRTVGGRRIFIRDGQSLEESMRMSGKFRQIKRSSETPKMSATEKNHIICEINTYYTHRFENKNVCLIAVNSKFGAYVYQFENYGYDQYRFTNKWSIK